MLMSLPVRPEVIPGRKVFDPDTVVSRDDLKKLVGAVLGSSSLRGVARLIRRWALKLNKVGLGSQWRNVGLRFGRWAERAYRGNAKPHWGVFSPGNSKLSFFSFSVLPVVTCPGAGDCVNYCYSYRSMIRPGPFFRMLGNILLLHFAREVIEEAFLGLPLEVIVRLYVDGDFESLQTLLFWMDLIRLRPDLQVYGYSKSWRILLEADRLGIHWPSNYVLNLSSGGRDLELLPEMRKLPIVRGEFLAISINYRPSPDLWPHKGNYPNTVKYKDPAYYEALKEGAEQAGIRNYFPCPGFCDNCSRAGHVCGMKNAKKTVLIGIH